MKRTTNILRFVVSHPGDEMADIHLFSESSDDEDEGTQA